MCGLKTTDPKWDARPSTQNEMFFSRESDDRPVDLFLVDFLVLDKAMYSTKISGIWVWVNAYRYIFSGMNIHLPAILGFTRYQGFDPSPYEQECFCRENSSKHNVLSRERQLPGFLNWLPMSRPSSIQPTGKWLNWLNHLWRVFT